MGRERTELVSNGAKMDFEIDTELRKVVLWTGKTWTEKEAVLDPGDDEKRKTAPSKVIGKETLKSILSFVTRLRPKLH